MSKLRLQESDAFLSVKGESFEHMHSTTASEFGTGIYNFRRGQMSGKGLPTTQSFINVFEVTEHNLTFWL